MGKLLIKFGKTAYNNTQYAYATKLLVLGYFCHSFRGDCCKLKIMFFINRYNSLTSPVLIFNSVNVQILYYNLMQIPKVIDNVILVFDIIDSFFCNRTV